jgi:hypothetical protein
VVVEIVVMCGSGGGSGSSGCCGSSKICSGCSGSSKICSGGNGSSGGSGSSVVVEVVVVASSGIS